MGKSLPLMFCRYALTIDEQGLDPEGQMEALEYLKGRPIAYRAKDENSDPDTFLFRPEKKRLMGQTLITWNVAKHLLLRAKQSYDKRNDDVIETLENTDEIAFTKFYALPMIGVLAVDDRANEKKLGGLTAISRFRAIFKSLPEAAAIVEPAGTAEDIQRALDTWELSEFDFSVRPFNPHPQKLGEKLHDLMRHDDIGVVRGKALPAADRRMHDSHQGLISEAKGLTDAGYGQVGLIGRTPGGRQAKVPMPQFDLNKEKNAKRQAAPRRLKVFVDGTAEDLDKEVVMALLEFFGAGE